MLSLGLFSTWKFVCIVQLKSDTFVFVYFFNLATFYFVMFCCHLLEVCSFLMREDKRVDSDGQEVGEKLGIAERWTGNSNKNI